MKARVSKKMLMHLHIVYCQDEAVQKVVEFMDAYSISQEDYDTIVELSKFKVPLLIQVL